MGQAWTLGQIGSDEPGRIARWLVITHYKLIYHLLSQSHDERRELGFIVYKNRSLSEIELKVSSCLPNRFRGLIAC
jgi:hypothetical protein